jgi:hypothetical protein
MAIHCQFNSRCVYVKEKQEITETRNNKLLEYDKIESQKVRIRIQAKTEIWKTY